MSWLALIHLKLKLVIQIFVTNYVIPSSGLETINVGITDLVAKVAHAKD